MGTRRLSAFLCIGALVLGLSTAAGEASPSPAHAAASTTSAQNLQHAGGSRSTPAGVTYAPVIFGVPKIGNTLKARTRTWVPRPSNVRYQWFRNSEKISGATTSAYVVSRLDGGAKISVKVSALRPGRGTATRTSKPVAVPRIPFVTTTTPRVMGTAHVGKMLTVDPGIWQPARTTTKYQWMRDGAPISGAAANSYTLTAADAGRRLSVKVIGSRTGYIPTARVSTSVSVPSPQQSAPTSPPPSGDPGTHAEDWVYLRGVNTQGGGSTVHDPTRVPGVAETDYHYNSAAFYQYLHSRGHKVVRIDFLWERVQHDLGGELDPRGLAELKTVVKRASDAGLYVLLDMHNYGRYWLPNDTMVKFGAGITAADFADVWGKLAVAFRDDAAVAGFGLMNEPWGLPGGYGTGSVWQQFSQAAVDAIRDTGDRRSILVAGDNWGGAWNWEGYNGAPWIRDAADNVIYEAHFYFDADSSGFYNDSYAATEAHAKAKGWPSLPARIDAELARFTGWLAKHGERGFIGEIGWPSGADASKWNALGQRVYEQLNAANVGATYWAAGEWLASADGMYKLDAYHNKWLSPQAQTAVIEAPGNLSLQR